MKNSDPTYVFIFVPVERAGENLQERLRDCIAALNEAQPENPPETRQKEEPHDERMPFWTWFLPNPLPKPKKSDA
jgi:hypothetical protein